MGRNGKRWMMVLVITTGLLCVGLGVTLLEQTSLDTYVQAKQEPERKTEKETESETETDTDKESAVGTENESEAESDSEIEIEIETESEIDAKIESESETEMTGVSEPERDTEEETEAPGPEPETPGSETETPEPETEASETEAPETETEAPDTEAPETIASEQETEAPVQEQVERGVHYDISGQDGAWYRDENGRLWIRGGTSLRVFPLPGSGYNTGKSKENVKKDGEISFRLKQVDGDGNVLKKSVKVTEPYFVDSEAPSATVQATGSRGDSCIYASGASAVSISVEPDAKSGLKSCFYKIVPCAADGSIPSAVQEGGWTECGASASFQISTEGKYRVYVKTQDRVGNVAFTGSEVICVDSTRPQLSVTGVEDQTANTGEVSIRVSCSDDYYKAGSLQAGITGVNQGYSPTISSRGSDASGEWVEFHDFPNLNEYDDVYEVNVSAEDLSGNRTESQMQFSLNRYGSVYDLSDETKALLQQYFLPKAGSIVFYETNIDYVGESAIYCRHDGEMRALEKGKDYSVTMEGTADTWKIVNVTMIRYVDFKKQKTLYLAHCRHFVRI